MTIAVIGNGAISKHVQAQLRTNGLPPATLLLRPGRCGAEPLKQVSRVEDLPSDTNLLIDCAGHSGLQAHGVVALECGLDVLTLSLGALADDALHQDLQRAALRGGARLLLASGAIGALDALRAAATGGIEEVTYIGRKPPRGWQGSPAETACDLAALQAPFTHFSGSARDAARQYPKNANVAAAVALSGIGFDATRVELVADPGINSNLHELHARGDFGEMRFSLAGNSLPDNPRSSALAAMSVVAAVLQRNEPVRF